jgi:hypothetical protein
MSAQPFSAMLEAVKNAGEDFEWYPTTDRMIDAVARWMDKSAKSLMDIGAGDGRVLLRLGAKCEQEPTLYSIEKSCVLIETQPENVVPVGTDLFEQNLACLPVDYIFCNPPYSQFETWAEMIITSGHAKKAFLIIPQRWKDSELIAAALKRRDATARVIHSDDFSDAERRARAVVDIVEISYPRKNAHGYRFDELQDPFDVWFDQNISTFDQEETTDGYQSEYDRNQKELARIRHFETIPDMVAGYNEEYERMQENYRSIFQLDYALLKELGVSKNAVRDGIKAKMTGLKSKYWTLLFERLDTITERLSTETKAHFLEKLTGRATIAFTANNAYAVVLWAIKNANKYFDQQTVRLFRDISTFEGVQNYKSNQRTWEKDGFRYHRFEEGDKRRPSHYLLDYRIVVTRYGAITSPDSYRSYESPGNLDKTCHELIDDIRAVLSNLGFRSSGFASRSIQWASGEWQNWHEIGTGDTLFQVKAFKNGNLHLRFKPDAIKALNVEAGRLLGWLRAPRDVETELGYSQAEAKRFYCSTKLIMPSNVRLLATSEPVAEVPPVVAAKVQTSLFEAVS